MRLDSRRVPLIIMISIYYYRVPTKATYPPALLLSLTQKQVRRHDLYRATL